ncbi:MAG: (2Fe-2S) ferredoxin domain-containing protein [Deltaproteobacteria bacterium]|nr:(2Fe-2S) ferredoxin domain-containing protein [Deltaproteobacteria bacterium]
MIKRQQPYIRQIFMCINNRHGESPSCGYSGSEEIVEELKKVAKDMNLKGKVRVAKSGCLDLCAFGPNLMIWPDGIWYMKVTKADIPEIIETYLKLEEADRNRTAASENAAGK